jgi:APA family basic amino acid/polyamine antiporter
MTLVLIVCFALFNFRRENLHPFVLEERGGWSATISAAALVYYSYLGFDVCSTLSDEAKNPVRDVPLSIVFTNSLSALVYISVSFSLVSMARLELFSPETALVEAFTTVGMHWVTKVLYFCGLIGISAAGFSNHIVSQLPN